MANKRKCYNSNGRQKIYTRIALKAEQAHIYCPIRMCVYWVCIVYGYSLCINTYFMCKERDRNKLEEKERICFGNCL